MNGKPILTHPPTPASGFVSRCPLDFEPIAKGLTTTAKLVPLRVYSAQASAHQIGVYRI